MSTQERRPAVPATSTKDRRRSPRLEVLDRLSGHLQALDLRLTLVNLSAEGFSMEAPLQFVVGGSHEFRFTAPGASPIVLTARVIHTKPDRETHLVGLEFENRDAAEFAQGIAWLLDHLGGTRQS